MEQAFLGIFYFFQKRRLAFWTTFACVSIVLAFLASRVTVEEDVSKFFPDDKRVEKLNYVFRNAKLADRIVLMVSIRDSTFRANADSLVVIAEQLVPELEKKLKTLSASVNAKVDDSRMADLLTGVQSNLPFVLDEEDYRTIDSLIHPTRIRAQLEKSFEQLSTPAGLISKRLIINDPLGISFLAVRKLQSLQIDENVELYDSYLVTKDHRHLFFFVQPTYKSSDTGHNAPLIDALDEVLNRHSTNTDNVVISYFGATAVSVANARQLQRDTYLTLSITIVLLAGVLLSYFKRKRIPLLIFVPVIFGAVFALAVVYLVQSSISILALAAGSIILGIAVNYSLHFFSHLQHATDLPTTIKDLVKPMTIGSTTTVLAFFCLQFVNAAVLRDVGLFAGLSLIGAALCSLIFLPQLYRAEFPAEHSGGLIERVGRVSFENNRLLLTVIVVLTPVFLYFAQNVRFNTDLSQLNFMSADLKTSQARLESINKTSLQSIYVVSQASSFEAALRENDRAYASLNSLRKAGEVQKVASVSTFIMSDSLQNVRLELWRNFWTPDKIRRTIETARAEGRRLHFSDKVFSNFETLISRDYSGVDPQFTKRLRSLFFDDYIIEKPDLFTVMALVNVDVDRKADVYEHLNAGRINAFDRQMVANLFVEYVHADFNFIVTFTSALVFLALLITYGRIELTLITFLPMLITWIWILGIMALVGIEFNIVNVMISTFIFGLGDDYSIFTMDALQQEYSYRKKHLFSIRTSIFLSAITTISGLGVLIFAQHPALRSIAAISIIGIVCVFIMSQTVEPFLFRWMITRRTEKGHPPMTVFGMIRTTFLYSFFVVGSLFLTFIGILLKLVPFFGKEIRHFYHLLICSYVRILIWFDPQIKVRFQGISDGDFEIPSVIVANHSSFLDILFTVMLHPKVILLTNKWVYNSPVFGGVVRLADYYPVMEGAEPGIARLKQRVDEGYSIVVFPEGTRTSDGTIKRFHKGAFYLAEALNLPIRPLVIVGAGDAIPKGDFYVNPTTVILNFLPVIDRKDLRFGSTYSERAKLVGREVREQYGELRINATKPGDFRRRLFSNYIFKGPILEWYMRIKVSLENDYEAFERMVPKHADVLDLGCGYGFLCYILTFTSLARRITGVDYDDDKISVAKNCFSKTERLDFVTADIIQYPVGQHDVIIIADVLHYLFPDDQERVLIKCFNRLNEGGKIIVRDGNADLRDRHAGTRLTELFSVKLLKFNKSTNELNFLSGSWLKALAEQHGFRVQVLDDTRLTSNNIFVISRNS